jgi:hypothetical protein
MLDLVILGDVLHLTTNLAYRTPDFGQAGPPSSVVSVTLTQLEGTMLYAQRLLKPLHSQLEGRPSRAGQHQATPRLLSTCSRLRSSTAGQVTIRFQCSTFTSNVC